MGGLKILPPNWAFNILASQRHHHTIPLTIDILPRCREVSVALNPCTGGSTELQSGVFFRYVLTVARIKTIEPPPDLMYIDSLCTVILSGYHSEQLWSGDWFCRWTPAAWQAAEDLSKAIERQIRE